VTQNSIFLARCQLTLNSCTQPPVVQKSLDVVGGAGKGEKLTIKGALYSLYKVSQSYD